MLKKGDIDGDADDDDDEVRSGGSQNRSTANLSTKKFFQVSHILTISIKLSFF
jgi:hypothetical protein